MFYPTGYVGDPGIRETILISNPTRRLLHGGNARVRRKLEAIPASRDTIAKRTTPPTAARRRGVNGDPALSLVLHAGGDAVSVGGVEKNEQGTVLVRVVQVGEYHARGETRSP